MEEGREGREPQKMRVEGEEKLVLIPVLFLLAKSFHWKYINFP